MLSRDKRPAVPVPRPLPAAAGGAAGAGVQPFNPAYAHPAYLPARVHVTAALATVPPTQIPRQQGPVPLESTWSDATKVSPAWEGWGRGPAELGKSRL
ncbi:uncharacterized protein EHS24_003702 [Apiotrichum porosum]|uniref:Uncharacterized protein n=1 Tax=Apiotrichum porosum TaxID=105984 RepID=A0A427XDY9_9TREE|nr:uncharacterized protein EHS24_003702 [Apiotrichum porosum]RSH77075.1 hypothetical protein EHS24_003702 [Apiotrichum porosum]